MCNSTTDTPEFHLAGAKILWFAFMAFLVVSTVFGNTLVLLAVLKDRNLRTPSNIILVNMGLGDLLFSLLSLPLSMVFISFRETWYFGGNLNKFFDAIWFGFVLLSFLNVIIIAGERYLAVLRPFWYQNRVTKSRVTFCCGCVWFYDAALMLGLVIFTFKTPEEKYGFLIPGYVYYSILYFHVVITFTLLPLFYYKIFIVAKRHEVKLCRQSRRKQQKYYCLQMKATRTVALVILLFIAVWLPFLVRQLLDIHKVFAGKWDTINTGLGTLTYCNGAVNFFVYSCRETKLRKALLKMLKCKK